MLLRSCTNADHLTKFNLICTCFITRKRSIFIITLFTRRSLIKFILTDNIQECFYLSSKYKIYNN